ncbi:helix-turn-helix domain-containing protein [Levilactobacillus brevis]|uniref:helix-turn-helix domain-containing protein n=1 Tax=Levilactobacillus brevis TaxID=1580 RepID=UPI00111AA952|nr:helix-turn-helix transcriptional regulator [Levilactobacillus brevis]QCZ51005.1 Transcriptional regulator xre family [Levilactobacillus brevis]
MTLFERVKKMSKERGLSLSQLNDKAGLGKNAIYKWKTQKPSTENIQKVASALGVTVDYLLSGEEQKNETTKKVNIEDLLDGTAMLTDRDGELTDADRAALRALISTYLQSTEGRERLKKYSNMELDDNGGNGDD